MQITYAEAFEAIMPKEDPNWRFALGARPDVCGVLVRLQTDTGLNGFGSCCDLPHLGYPFVAVLALAQQVAGTVQGADARDRRPLLAKVARIAQGCPPVRAAFELALYDLVSKAFGLPLYRYLGGAFRKSVPLMRILPLKEPAEVAASALRLVKEGYRYLKIKLEGVSELDAARVIAVREAVGPGIHLTLDANQSFSPKGAIQFYRRVAPYRIDLFEQPVRQDDFAGLREVTSSVDCTVEADESADSLPAIQRLVSMRAVDAISLKINKLGGLDPMAEAAALCHAANIACRVGATVGSSLMSAAAMHFVAATPNITYACELAEFARLRDDPFTGLSIVDGELAVTEQSGIGVKLANGRLMP